MHIFGDVEDAGTVRGILKPEIQVRQALDR
jgi:hypothetical protein